MNEIEKEPAESESPESLAEPVDAAGLVELEAASGSKVGQSVTRSAGIVSIAVFFSRILGLVRELVFAHFFGAGFLNDAFQFAFRIPNVLRDLFAEGALSVAFVKVFTDYLITKNETEAWRLASLVLNALAVVLSVIALFGIFFASTLVELIARGFSPEKAALAAWLTQIMFPFIVFVAMAALAMGVLNSKGKFGVPASASTVFNIVSIIAGLGIAYWLSGGSWVVPADKNAIPEPPAQYAIIGMAIGTLLGGMAQFLIQVPSLRNVGFRFMPVLSFADPGIKRIMLLMGPAIIGTSAVQINVLVNTFFVSGIEGGLSWLGYAFRLMQFPIGIFGVAVGTASIPVLSRLASEERTVEFRNTLSSSINLVFLLTLPSACGLIVLGQPIIRMLYANGGAFKESDVPMTAWALAGYAIGLTGYAAIKVLSPAFFALNDAKTPMVIALISIVVNAVACYFLMNLFSGVGVTEQYPNGFGHVGVALATSCVALVNFLVLAWFMRKKIGRLNGREIASSFVRIAIASAAMSVVAYFSFQWISGVFENKTLWVRITEAFLPIALSGVAFFIAAKLLKIDELEKIVSALSQKVGIQKPEI